MKVAQEVWPKFGSAPISVETGQYKNRKYISREEDICLEGVQDQFHVLMNCNLYGDLRKEIFETISTLYHPVSVLSEIDKFVVLMSNECIIIVLTKAAILF